MTVDTPPRYRFAAFRRAGLFGNVPASLLITLAVGVIAGWLAVLSHAPLPLAVAPLLLCGLVGFGRVRGRPIHEMIPRLAVWGWRRLLRSSAAAGAPLRSLQPRDEEAVVVKRRFSAFASDFGNTTPNRD